MTPDSQKQIEQTLTSLTPSPLPDYLHARLGQSLDNKLTLPEKLLGLSLSLAAAALLFIVLSLTLQLTTAPTLNTPTPANTPTAYTTTPADLQQLLAAK